MAAALDVLGDVTIWPTISVVAAIDTLTVPRAITNVPPPADAGPTVASRKFQCQPLDSEEQLVSDSPFKSPKLAPTATASPTPAQMGPTQAATVGAKSS